ncbi:hypothetical protein [Roseivirga sp.]|uniref:hypothetical protein n=1 Tax=Roseivirga sp. TaxID=1964215 RepID=UPI003B8DE31B
MSEKIQLEIYSFAVREFGSEENINLGSFYNDQDESLSFLDTFLRFSDSLTNMKVDNITQRTFEVINESIKVNAERISGIMEYGSFGYAADLKNIRNQEVNYRKKTTDTEQRPYYFMICAPRNYDIGFFILQRTGINGIKGVFEHSMRNFYRESYNNLVLDIQAAIPEELINRYIDEGNFGSISISKYGLPEDLADRILDEDAKAEYDSDNIKVEIKLTKRGGFIPANKKVRRFLNDQESSFFSAQELGKMGFDEDSRVHIESTLGNKKRVIDLSDHMRFRPYYSIDNELNFDASGNPTFESIDAAANRLLDETLGV